MGHWQRLVSSTLTDKDLDEVQGQIEEQEGFTRRYLVQSEILNRMEKNERKVPYTEDDIDGLKRIFRQKSYELEKAFAKESYEIQELSIPTANKSFGIEDFVKEQFLLPKSRHLGRKE